MILLAMMFAAAGAVAVYFNKKITETLPMVLFFVMSVAYAGALLGRLSGVAKLMPVLLAFIMALLIGVKIKKAGTKETGSLIYKTVISIESAVIIIGAAIIVFTFKNHFVTNWDDFNYWAMFSRDIFAKGGMASGTDLCTGFKDYTPIVQLLYFVVFKHTGGFSEGWMFAINNLILFVLLLPMLSDMADKKKRVSSLLFAAVGLLFPLATMFQQLHCLGVDCILSLLFGYILYLLLGGMERDLPYYVNLALVLFVLVLVKATGIIPFAILLIVCLAYNKKENIKYLLLCFAAGLCGYFSWNIFCKIKGNVSYLGQRVSDSVGGVHLPDYTAEVLKIFAKNIAFLHLNDGRLGITPLAAVVIAAILTVTVLKLNASLKKPVIVLWVGLMAYLLMLLYMYLFIFDKWEALSLSSFDRYVSVYLLGMLYGLILIIKDMAATDKRVIRGMALLLLLMIATMNYGLLYNMLLPGQYRTFYSDIWDKRQKVEGFFVDYFRENPENLGKRLVIVNEKGDDELEKFQQYAAVPSVTKIYRLDENPSDEEAINGFAASDNAKVVYYGLK